MESVVFYNFLQVAAGEDAVSAKAFDAKYSDVSNMKAFKEVLDHTGPDVVVSWGYRLWETLPNDWGFGEAEKGVGIPIEGKNFYCYYTYPFNGKPILLIGAHHPSVGYDSKFHSDIFAALDVG